MTSNDQAPQIFLSYARADGRDYVQRLANDLTKPPHQYDIWWDQRDINPYQDFSAEIEIAIRNSAYVVTCITPSIEANPESFVRREIIYSQAVKKPIIPLIFPPANPIILINHLTWLDFGVYQAGLQALLTRLAANPQPEKPRPTDDPFHDYLEAMLQAVNRQIEARDIVRLIDVTVSPTPGMVQGKKVAARPKMQDYHRTQADSSPLLYENFAQAVNTNKGRLLLLGEPGAGKSVTLLAYARQAFTNRLNDSRLPLPFYADLVTWDSLTQPPLAAWAAESVAELETTAESLIHNGQALLILDGLDELGESRPLDPNNPKSGTYDPRQRLLTALEAVPHSNQVLISCRVKDYSAFLAKTRHKLPLNGAVTLQPLNDGQLEAYFAEDRLPQLWQALQADSELQEVARTPLLLSLFTYAFKEADPALLENFQGKPELYYLIFNTYLEKRWKHEKQDIENLPMTFEEFKNLLMLVAYKNLGNYWRTKNHIFPNELVKSFIGEELAEIILQTIQAEDLFQKDLHDLITKMEQIEGFLQKDLHDLITKMEQAKEFIKLALLLHSLVQNLDNTYHFIHLILYHRLAYQQAEIYLNDPTNVNQTTAIEVLGRIGDERAKSKLLELLQNPVHDICIAAIRALGQIGESSTISNLAERLHAQESAIRKEVVWALGKIKNASAVPALIEALKDQNGAVRKEATWVLGEIGDPSAVPALIEVLKDNDQDTRRNAAEALTKIGWQPSVQEERISHAFAGQDWEQLITIGIPAIPIVIQALSDQESYVRKVAAEALGQIGDANAVSALIERLQDREEIGIFDEERVCDAAAEALEQIGTAEALEAVAKWRAGENS